MGNIEVSAPLMAKFGRIINLIVSTDLVSNIIKKTVGYVNTPQLSISALTSRVNKAHTFNFELLNKLSAEQQNEYVLIVKDPFSLVFMKQN